MKLKMIYKLKISNHSNNNRKTNYKIINKGPLFKNNLNFLKLKFLYRKRQWLLKGEDK